MQPEAKLHLPVNCLYACPALIPKSKQTLTPFYTQTILHDGSGRKTPTGSRFQRFHINRFHIKSSQWASQRFTDLTTGMPPTLNKIKRIMGERVQLHSHEMECRIILNHVILENSCCPWATESSHSETSHKCKPDLMSYIYYIRLTSLLRFEF